LAEIPPFRPRSLKIGIKITPFGEGYDRKLESKNLVYISLCSKKDKT